MSVSSSIRVRVEVYLRGTLWQRGQTAWAMPSRHRQDERSLTSGVPSLPSLCHWRKHCCSKTPWSLPVLPAQMFGKVAQMSHPQLELREKVLGHLPSLPNF